MTQKPNNIHIIGAGSNGLVATTSLAGAGRTVTLLEREDRPGGVCVSATAEVDGISHDYALGATTLGLMQDFVWQETGLSDRLQSWTVTHPDLVFSGWRRPRPTV